MWWLEHLNASPTSPRGAGWELVDCLGASTVPPWERSALPAGESSSELQSSSHSRAPGCDVVLAIDAAGKAARPTHCEELAKITE